MAKLAEGVSSPEVKKLQQNINKVLGKGTVKETGSYDEATTRAVAEMQKTLGLAQTGTADDKTLNAVKEAMEPRTQVTVKGKTAWVTKSQLAQLKSKANAKAAGAVQGYVNMANETKLLWDAHDKNRKDNWFISGAVDLATGSSFPSKGVIDKATSAANTLKSAAASGTLKPNALGSQSAPIRQACAAIDQYRSELYSGGAELINQLQDIQDACVTTLQITSAIATGGASWQIQVGVAAGMGAYEAVLGEIDKASHDHKQTAGSAAMSVIKGAAVDGAIAYIMKGQGKGLGNWADDVAEQAIKDTAGSGAKGVLKEYAVRAVNGGGQKLVEDGLKGITSLNDPKSPRKPMEFVKAAAKSFGKGAGLGVLGKATDKFGAAASKHFTAADFKGLGDVKFDKALADGGKAAIDKAGSAAVKKVLSKWDVKKNHASFEKEVKMCILKDPGVNKWIKKAAKKHNKK
jgi:peptidoglycan hydrolase-like protein with peptidoglycan-binding domain